MTDSATDIWQGDFRPWTVLADVRRARDSTLNAYLFKVAMAILSVTVVLVALSASLFSLYMGFNELSRRAESAMGALIPPIAKALEGGKEIPDATVVLNDLSIDPDIVDGSLFDQDGRVLATHAGTTTTGPGDLGLKPRKITWSPNEVVARIGFDTAHGPMSLSLRYRTTAAWRRAERQFILFLVAGFAGLVVVSLVLRGLLRHHMRPWRDLVASMVALVDEDYRHPVAGLDRRGEIGDMARAMETFRAQLIDRENLRRETDSAHLATANQHRRIDARVDEFRASIRDVLREVGGLSEQMTVAADGLKSIATQSSHRAEDASHAIQQTSANVDVVAKASEDLSASIHEIERQVEQTRVKVGDATRCTADTGKVMQGLFAKAEQIGEIIELIQSIAAQTNLLSLNATIEAARAGEAGRGFAVVAQEVKQLADQTAKASKHVADHIIAIQDATSRAVEAIGTIDKTMSEAERFTAIISTAVERQAVATAEISRSAADAARSADIAAGSMKRLVAAVGETDQSAAQVHQSAGDVGQQAQDLNTTVDHFLRDTATLRGAA